MKTFVMEDEPIGMQMAPMIDITFLLIVFFMVAANVSQTQKVKIELAEANEAKVSDDQSMRTIVTVNEAGDLFYGSRAVTIEELSTQLALEGARMPELKIFLRADRNTDHLHVRQVMAACAEAGLIDIIFSTYEK